MRKMPSILQNKKKEIGIKRITSMRCGYIILLIPISSNNGSVSLTESSIEEATPSESVGFILPEHDR